MSRTFELGCDECKMCVWIAQQSASGKFWVYTEGARSHLFEMFLQAHEGHALKFLDSEVVPDTWAEVTFDRQMNTWTPVDK